MANFMQMHLNQRLPGEGQLPTTPPRPQPTAAPHPPSNESPPPIPVEGPGTLYHAGDRLHIREGMSVPQALGEVADWLARTRVDDHGLFVTPGATGSGGGSAELAVTQLVTLLRRDMQASGSLRDMPNGPTLAIMGLLVPVEVCAIRRGPRGQWYIQFLADSADCGEVRLEAELEDQLGAAGVDMVYALAPALAAFLHSHGAGSARGVARLLEASSPLQATGGGLRPVVPGCVRAPVKRSAAGLHVGRRLTEARLALLQCGYHVPTLDYVELLGGITLEAWLRVTTGGMQTVRDQMRRVDELQRQLAAAVEDLCFLARTAGLHHPDPTA